jgi:AcrR family transcriptional regulator
VRKPLATVEPAKRARRMPDDLLKRCGYVGTTTAAIARNAGITEAQLFRYYGSKSNLFGETIFKPLDERFLRFIDAHKPATLSDAEMREQKAVYTSELQRFIRTNSKMFTSLVAAEIYGAGTEHGAEQMRGRLKDKSAIAPELMVRLVFLSVLSAVMFRDWIFPKSLANPARIRPGPSAGERCRTASARADMHQELDHYLQA